jgi:hypothetical protein
MKRAIASPLDRMPKKRPHVPLQRDGRLARWWPNVRSDDPTRDMIRLWEQMFPPFKFWMQAAEAYQRQLMNPGSGWQERRTPPHRRVA